MLGTLSGALLNGSTLQSERYCGVQGVPISVAPNTLQSRKSVDAAGHKRQLNDGYTPRLAETL